MKRLFDIVGAFVLLILLLPLLLVIAVLVRVKLGSPVLFRQARPGRGARLFTLVKFRTMVVAAPGAPPAPDSERLTSFGRRLRASSLDELPELWNVLRGEMSLVGPRPLLTAYLDRYSPEQARRHEVRPGITGWAQVNGRNATTWEERLRLDVWYVDSHSLALDLRILLRTVRLVCSREGISAPGEATMKEFEGSKPSKLQHPTSNFQ
ncbi:MAG TPA: sugar transferase [Opitutaceae bacterium]|nr:sugar transferase [Opitutaceae bacterium]